MNRETYLKIFNQLDWEEEQESIYNKTDRDVREVLQKSKLNLEDFKVLISPPALKYLDIMAKRSAEKTQKRFGKTVQFYAPLYLSNECNNICTYCGFSLDNRIKRRTLTPAEVLKEAQVLKEMGIDHVLLVTGESHHNVGMEYFRQSIKAINGIFSSISVEVQPLEEKEYSELVQMGVNTVLVYQETYNRESYAAYHPKGKKRNFDYRLETPDRIGKSNMYRIGLGVLLGLEDWRTDGFFLASHLNSLEKTYWKSKYSISFPRLRPFTGEIEPKSVISDSELVQLICAFRLFNEEVELSISTRETENFRDNIFKIGATTMSVASKTNPGGYSVEPKSLEQFEVSDERTVPEFEKVVLENQYDVIFKDWDKVL